MAYDDRTWKAAGLMTAGVVVLICVAATLGFLAGRAPATGMPAAATVSALPEPAPIADAAGFIQAVAGDWLGPGEQLLIRHDKGVVEILRQTRADKGEVRLDQYAAAPVRLDATQRRMELETQEGLWLMTLVPGTPRAQLSITYPDQHNVLYQ